MGIVISMLVAASTLVASTSSDPAALRVVENGLFETDLASFTKFVRTNKRLHPSLDWKTDYCSAPLVGSTGRSFDFRVPCHRHDFGYRNMKRLGRWDESIRGRIDERFRDDMHTTCTKRGITQRFNCFVWAETFYRAVRVWGT
jgi:hypothetical protein